jgi:hypothetical protein
LESSEVADEDPFMLPDDEDEKDDQEGDGGKEGIDNACLIIVATISASFDGGGLST